MLIREISSIDPDKFVTLDLIRAHTRQDDLAGVQDQLLALYRLTAMEAATDYTGVNWFRLVEITEAIKPRQITSLFGIQRPRRITVTYKPSEPYFEVRNGIQSVMIDNISLEKSFVLPTMLDCSTMDCGCGNSSMQSPLSVVYKSGTKTCEKYPPGLVLGAMKMIAWLLENPGDELNFVESPAGRSVGVGANLLKGTNNAAYASGAIEEWRRYREAIAT